MRFTVEQILLTDVRGDPAKPERQYHVVEAESVDAALQNFMLQRSADLVGPVQKFNGFQAVATARSVDSVFTVHILPGSDGFLRGAEQRTDTILGYSPSDPGTRPEPE